MALMASMYIILLLTGMATGNVVRSNARLRRPVYREPKSNLHGTNTYNNYSPNQLVQQKQRNPSNVRRNRYANQQIYQNKYYTYDNNNPYNVKKYKKDKKRKKKVPPPTTTTTTASDSTDIDTDVYDTDTEVANDGNTVNDADYSDLYSDTNNINTDVENIDNNVNIKTQKLWNDDQLYDADGDTSEEVPTDIDQSMKDGDNNLYINKKSKLKTKIQNKKEYATQIKPKNDFDDIDNDNDGMQSEYDNVETNIQKVANDDELYENDDDELYENDDEDIVSDEESKHVLKLENEVSSDDITNDADDNNIYIHKKSKSKPRIPQIELENEDSDEDIDNDDEVEPDNKNTNFRHDNDNNDIYVKKKAEIPPKKRKKKAHTTQIESENDDYGNIDNNEIESKNMKANNKFDVNMRDPIPSKQNQVSETSIASKIGLINKDEIDLSLLCTIGNGTQSNPWIITEDTFYTAIVLLSENIRSIYLASGWYYSSKPIHIDFGSILSDNSIIRTGIRIYGHYAYWTFADNNSGNPSLHIEWINDDTNPNQISLFYWELSGIEMYGSAKYELVKIGCNDINACPLNSFVIDLVVGNNYRIGNSNNVSSTAIGIRLIQILQSKIKLVATCVEGIALYLDNGQFNDIFGSFSNGLTTNGKSIYLSGICLYLQNGVSNTFSSINLENCYDGIYFVNYSYGNVFNSLISNNEDNRGYVISLVDKKFENITNVIDYLVIRTSIQGNNSYPNLWVHDYSDSIKIIAKTQG